MSSISHQDSTIQRQFLRILTSNIYQLTHHFKAYKHGFFCTFQVIHQVHFTKHALFESKYSIYLDPSLYKEEHGLLLCTTF